MVTNNPNATSAPGPLSYLSRSRSQLMAFAILGVLFVHSGIKIPDKLLNSFVDIGYGGVDMFFFLSGFGLYYSSAKDNRVVAFWLKRLKRIMPSFIVCIILTQLTLKGRINWTHLWQDALIVGYWIRQLRWHYFAWFISGIMGLYLIFPFYYRAFRRYPRGATVHASLVGLICAGIYSYYFLVLHPKGCNAFIHLFARTPLFFLGVLFAYLCQLEAEGRYHLSKTKLLLLLVLPFVGYKLLGTVTRVGLAYSQLRNSGAIFYPFILIVPGFSLALGYALYYLPHGAKKILAWVGSSTLEMYCLIGCVFHFRPQFERFAGGNIPGCLLLIMACILSGIIVHYGVAYLTKQIGTLAALIHRAKSTVSSSNP